MALTPRRDGQTAFGSDRVASCAVAVNAKLGSASGLVLVDSAGVEYFIWVDNTGELRMSSTRADFDTNPDTAGTVVGSQ